MTGHPFVMLSETREVRTVDARGRETRHGSLPGGDVLWGEWGLKASDPASFSWPTWSPDGRRVACFRLPDPSRKSAALFVLDPAGVVTTELSDLGSRLPIYLHWSPSGNQLAWLAQKSGGLDLFVQAADAPGTAPKSLCSGSPLFFTWAGERVAAFVGDRAGVTSRIEVFEPGRARSTVLPGLPGNFCAPLWIGERVVYVRQEGGRAEIVTSTVDDPTPRVLEVVDGLVALVASPDRRHLLRGVAPGGDGTPYRDLARIDVESGEITPLVDAPCLAFFWLPQGDGAVIARVDTEQNLVAWHRVGFDGTAESLPGLYPTRDFAFLLRFFEQYHQSHQLVDPAGRHLLLAGSLEGRSEPTAPPRIWRVDLESGDADDLGEGLFAAWAP
jgi:dipeptidyl aminopeptidase/acylaminoacyl peptidase